MKEKSMNKKEERKALNGTGDILHALSMADTVLCALLVSFLTNILLFNTLGTDALVPNAPSDLFLFSNVDGSVSFRALAACCIIIIIMLLAANALIYRKIVRKIFEHYSIVFIGAGALTLLFMLAYSQKTLYLIAGGILLFTGSIFLLIYGIIYKRNVSHDMPHM